MKSQLVEALNPDFEPVVLVRSEHKPVNILTHAVPWKLFTDLEAEASDGIFASPLWLDMTGR